MDRPEFHRLAERELNKAAQHYDREEPARVGVVLPSGSRPVPGVDRAHPEEGAILRGSVRRRLLRRLPYALLYKIKPSGIRILAVMNLKRRPGYWVGRE